MAGDLEGLTSLTQGEIDHLFFTIESSLQIRRRYQFYVWAQSRLSTLIPHDMLICGHYDHQRRLIHYDNFSMFPVPKSALEKFLEPVNGWMPKLIETWISMQGTPYALNTEQIAPEEKTDLSSQMRNACIAEVLAHGMGSNQDDHAVETFFVFLRLLGDLVPKQIKRDLAPITGRHSFILEILQPHLHATYMRTLTQERTREAPPAAPSSELVLVTERELEILGWVREGKSNQEIGVQLNISPLTVKNHIQKILRKLNASNRAQAVSKALSLRLITQTVNSN